MQKIEYRYDSPPTFLAALESRGFQPGILGDPSSRSSESNGSWSGTDTYDTALQLAISGDPKVAATIQPRDVDLSAHGALNTTVYDHSGDSVDVGRYLGGDPECMMSMRKKGKPIINILVNIGANSGISASVLQSRGKAILEIMSGLETNGYGVEITLVSETQSVYGLRYRVSIKVKDSKEYFNLTGLAYWLTNPSVLRRLNFRHREGEPSDVQASIGSGYGSTADVPQSDLDMMPDCVYFPAVQDNDTGRYERAIQQIIETYKP